MAAPLTIPVEQVAPLIPRRIGLIVGPGCTLGDGAMRRIARASWRILHNTTSLAESETIDGIDELVDDEHKAEVVRLAVRKTVLEERSQGQVAALGQNRWAAVLSLTLDHLFETRLNDWCTAHPSRPTVTVVSDLRKLVLPPRTIPVYKMVGSVFTEDFPVSTVDTRIRTSLWPPILRQFAEIVKGSAVLCIGAGENVSALVDLLAPMVATPSLAPGPLILLADDPASSSPAIRQLEAGGLQIYRVRSDIGALMRIALEHENSGFTQQLPFSAASRSLTEELREYSDVAVVVPSRTKSQATEPRDSREANRLRELLFSPSIPNWEAHAADLDFPRTVTGEIVRAVSSCFGSSFWRDFEIQVQGPAAVGKTTILKRAAFELASEGLPVVWVKTYAFQDGPTVLKQMFDRLKKAKKIESLVVFADDPIGLGSIRLDDIRNGIESTGLRVVLVTGVRTTDVASSDAELENKSEYASQTISVPETFDDAEWNSLAEYLVRLGVASDTADGIARVTNAPGRGARDVLSMLYYLLPETQARIDRSVREEYLRLGDRASLRRFIIGGYEHTGDILKKAYEFVAVASKYNAPLPMEVLVSALKTDYTQWQTLSGAGDLAFGLFYQEESLESQSVTYRTRNDVVSDIIVTTINGGVSVHGGEVACLRELLAACDAGAPAYREFCLSVLVPDRDSPGPRPQLHKLDFEDRFSLFDTAIASLPAPEPTLLHHKGIWQSRAGNTAGARATLEKALAARPYPYASRAEAPEHIHTSAATNEIRAMKAGTVEFDEGKKRVLHHLERASSSTFFNPNAIHQKAILVGDLADLTRGDGTKDPDADWFSMLGLALAELDRAILKLRSAYSSSKEQKNIEMLDDARGKLLDRCLKEEDAPGAAERLWVQHHSQEGFVLIGRQKFGEALRGGTGVGSELKAAFEYCIGCATRVLESGEEPSVTLVEVMLHIYFHWRVRRYVMTENAEKINWSLIQGYSSRLTRSPKTASEPFYKYLEGLATAHLGDWQKAKAIFGELRKAPIALAVMHEPRDYLMQPGGAMKRLQGMMTSAGSERFLWCDEVQYDFACERRSNWANEGNTEHAYIRFSYAGPLAVKEP